MAWGFKQHDKGLEAAVTDRLTDPYWRTFAVQADVGDSIPSR